jgi:dsDNA-specific endonuclease/ATPase MutS2
MLRPRPPIHILGDAHVSLIAWLRKIFSPRRVGEDASAALHDDAPDEEDVDPFNPFPEPVRLETRDTLDLHAFAPRDVGRVVEEYLREARAEGFRQVRIIHGKGVGVQRETVRKVLARTPFVEHFSDAPPEAGGWGATIVRMKAEG